MSDIAAGDVEIEALVLGVVLGAAEVPFADAGGNVARRFERLGNGDLFQGRNFRQSGIRRALVGASPVPGIQSVRCNRAGYLPVMMLARVGEHTAHAA